MFYTSAHLTLLPNCLFFSSPIFLSTSKACQFICSSDLAFRESLLILSMEVSGRVLPMILAT